MSHMHYYNCLPSTLADEESERQCLVDLESSAREHLAELAGAENLEASANESLRHLVIAETDSRKDIEKAEFYSSESLRVAAELLLYGAVPHWNGARVTLPKLGSKAQHVSDSVEQKDSSRVMRDISIDEVARPLQRLRAVLLRDEPGSLSEIVAHYSLKRESDHRAALVADEVVERRRIRRSERSARPSDTTKSITTGKGFDLRDAMGALQREETQYRSRMWLEAKHFSGLMHLWFTFLAAIEWEVSNLRDEERRKRVTISDRLRQRVENDLRRRRFSVWRCFTSLRCLKRYQRAAISRSALASMRRLLVKYVTRWSLFYLSSSFGRRFGALFDAEGSTRVWLVFDEEENRARLTLEVLEQAGSWTDLTDQHFAGLDRIHARDNARITLKTMRRVCTEMQLYYLQRWYSWWRQRDLTRRAVWLGGRFGFRSQRDMFERWVTYTKPAVQRRADREALHASEGLLRARLEFAETEARARAAIVFAESDGRVCVECFHAECFWRVRSQLAIVLSIMQLERFRRYTFGRWVLWSKLRVQNRQFIAVQRIGDRKRRADVFSRWSSWFATRSELRKLAFSDRLLLTADTDEWSARLPILRREDYLWCHIRRTFFSFAPMRRLDIVQRLGAIVESALRRSMLLRWRTCVSAIQRQRTLRSVAKAELEVSRKLLLRHRFTAWAEFARCESMDVRYRRERWRFAEQETQARASVEVHEADMRRVILAAHVSEVAVRIASKKYLATLRLASQANDSLCMRRLALWRRYARETRRRRAREAALRAMAIASDAVCRLRFFRRWFQTVRLRERHTRSRVEVFLSMNNLMLLSRYYRKLLPSAVRLARVSWAKRRLADARAASRQLLAEEASEAAEGLASHTQLVFFRTERKKKLLASRQ